jgi:tRNA pseudouridine38-40 synthase
MVVRYFLEVMYDGTAFHGSQLQGDIPSVQLSLNQALHTLLRRPVFSLGASRTDEGVHAHCNFYHFDFEGVVPPQLLYKLNAVLPPTISVSRIYTAAHKDMNARFDALSRQYRYRIYTHKNPFLVNRAYYHPFKTNFDLLTQMAAIVPEYTHFEAFCKRNTQSKTFTCRISQSRWEISGAEWHYVVEANRFLRGMVRGLVGTQLYIARHNAPIRDFRAIIESNDCRNARFNVPGSGLYLEQIRYPAGMLLPFPLL